MTAERADGTTTEQGAKGLGTFAGVFTPSILTILGIILFLRLGFVVGNAGLGLALVVILLANLISVLTSFSLAAIATNFKVRGGGDYYLISRTLGPEFGGAIGLVLFLAQSVSVAFYAIGFAEGVTALVDWMPARAVAGAALLPLFALAWMGADWATRFQYGIMVVLFLAIGVFFAGALQAFDYSVLAANWSPSGDLTFWAVFALFFPAVTGFTQGVSRAGRSRPSGCRYWSTSRERCSSRGRCPERSWWRATTRWAASRSSPASSSRVSSRPRPPRPRRSRRCRASWRRRASRPT